MLLAVATPMHMMAPISDGTLSVVPVTNSIHRMPAIAPGSAVRMMNGSSHDWKFTAISRYTSTTAKTMPNPRRKKEDCMVSTCPRKASVVPRGRCACLLLHDLLHVRCRRRPDRGGRRWRTRRKPAHVVMVDDHRGVTALHGHQVRQQLRAARRSRPDFRTPARRRWATRPRSVPALAMPACEPGSCSTRVGRHDIGVRSSASSESIGTAASARQRCS